jgi:hypothetical protein
MQFNVFMGKSKGKNTLLRYTVKMYLQNNVITVICKI